MIVVSDMTPLRYLAAIGGLEWLPEIFGSVVCPQAVMEECRHEHAPDTLRAWASAPPEWLQIVPVSGSLPAIPAAVGLDAGEAAALRLARELRADLLLLDERKGRLAATQIGIEVTGTVGVIVEAAMCGLVDFEAAIERLRGTNFRVHEAVVSGARKRLKMGGERPG